MTHWLSDQRRHIADKWHETIAPRRPSSLLDVGGCVDRSELIRSYEEHHLTISKLSNVHADSGIDIDNPFRSDGLSSEEAAKRLRDGGRNVMGCPHEKSNLLLFLHQFCDLFWLLLLVAALLSIVTYFFDTSEPINLYVAAILNVMVFTMCVVSYAQAKCTRDTVQGAKALLPASCSVVRDGQERKIADIELVVGDIVYIRSGGRVPADIRILQSNGLKLEASSITGEDEPIEITHEATAKHVSVFDSKNVAFNGCYCVEGEAIGIVIRTGNYTAIGRISWLTNDQKRRRHSLKMELNRFKRLISMLAIIMASVLFVVGCLVSHVSNSTVLLKKFIIGFLVITVANIPQGLPATITSQLNIIAQKMAKKNVLLKKLEIIDELGAATVIAVDKTGTLTRNNTIVTGFWYNRRYMTGMPTLRQRIVKDPPTNIITNNCDLFESYERPLPDILSVMAVCNKALVQRSSTNPNKPSKSLLPPMLCTKKFVVTDAETGTTIDPRKDTMIDRKQSMHPAASCEKHITGHPCDVALLRYVDQLAPVDQVRSHFKVVYEIPFNSLRKTHLAIVKPYDSVTKCEIDAVNTTTTVENGEEKRVKSIRYMVMMKGAPEVLIERCSRLATDSDEIDVDESTKLELQQACNHYGSEGRMLIGFAMGTFEAPSTEKFTADSKNFPQHGLCFLGMVAITDPIRDDTIMAIQKCKAAGIKIFMITGDHPSTATAIARQIGLIGGTEMVQSYSPQKLRLNVIEEADRESTIVHGEALRVMTPDEWDKILAHRCVVFARTTPEQKLLIVEQCQQRDEIVAVTGDGVSDVLALKKADIGIAMGICGSDVAKQAADIVLLDDNFASIVKGIEEGRLLFDNLRKTIAYTLTHIWPEICPIVLNFALGMPLGLSTLQILSIDLASEMPPAISLAYENPERDIMNKPPRKRSTGLVNFNLLMYSYVFAGSIVTVGCVLAYLSVYWSHNINLSDLLFSSADHWHHDAANFTSNDRVFSSLEQLDIMGQASAAWHITVVMSQVYHLYMCTTRRVSIFRQGISNLMSIFAIVVEVLLVNLFVYTPAGQNILGSRSPPTHVWLFSIGVGLALLIFNEGRKYLIRNRPHMYLVKILKW